MRKKNDSSLSKWLRGRKDKKGRRSTTRSSLLRIEPLEVRNLMAQLTFQQGVGGYEGAQDTIIYSRDPDAVLGAESSMSPDQQDANGVRQGLMKFENIFGNGAGQIPFGATINSATLIVEVINDSNSAMQMSLYRMQEDWDEGAATWNSFGDIGGVQASEGEASDLPPDAVLFDPDTSTENPATAGRFDVTRSLEYWAAGEENFGWVFESAATNGWDFRTKEGPQNVRPRLIVTFNQPAAAGTFQIIDTSVTSAEGTDGNHVAIVEVARLGDISAAASVNYTVTAGTAGAGDFVAQASTPLNFAAGEALKTIEIEIVGDDELETAETINVTLSGGSLVAGRGAATVTIADDDALINEVLANISSNDDETDREYIELIGTPGASLNGYYFVVFEAEEEELGGTAGQATGIADLVVNLNGQTFGENGLLVIAGNNWAYEGQMDPLTEIMKVAAFDAAGGILEDSSQTYALIRSPAAIVQGTDYDTVGTYEDGTNQAIGVGVGILDQLPAGAVLVDSVGVVEGGGGDRDRTLTTEALGHPGIHVHQPTPLVGSSVSSDAVTRRLGQTLPNSIGAWYNGDIQDRDSLRYLADSFFISVVAPDGPLMTPGQHNILRNVFFSVDDQDVQVPEADGSVTLRIERTGDVANEAIDVTYRTVDLGSAAEGEDYVGVEETITFAAGESFKDITIDFIADDDAEGFEEFRVEIVSVTGGYLITNGKSNQGEEDPALVANGEATVEIADANVSIATFQDGVDGYTGTSDAYIDGNQIVDKFGQDPIIRVDQVKGEFGDEINRPQQGLIRFDDLFGAELGQVPAGSKIFDAFITVNVSNTSSGADVRFFRMLEDWEQVNATWVDLQGNLGNSIVNGVTPNDVEALAEPDGRVAQPGRGQLNDIRLSVDTIQSFANGSLDNYGWSIISNSPTLWAFNSSEAFLAGTVKPKLTILYTAPEAGEAGEFSIATDNYVVNENGTATITVNRIGGSTGAVNLDWTLSANVGDLTDVSGATSGVLSFAAGELFKTFDVAINDDAMLESNETLNISISGAGVATGRDSALLTIRDNDLLTSGAQLFLNEIWINSPGNDPPHEFVELFGTSGIGMGSLYYVAVEGLVGEREGSAENIVDLGAYANGSGGFTLITPNADGFAFHVPAGATQVDTLGTIAKENVASQNDTTTYMLIYSPLSRLATSEFDYDWQNQGSFELPAGATIIDSLGVRVLGNEDFIYGPSTNAAAFDVSDPEVDAVSRRNPSDVAGGLLANRGSQWFGGDLQPGGDDYLLYEAAEAFGLPVAGTAMTPGEANTRAASPLGTFVEAVVNGGKLTLTFDSPVSQELFGDGSPFGPEGAGLSITGPGGVALTTVDAFPIVSGLGTTELLLSFSGSGVVAGSLPAGDYELHIVGNGFVVNGRALDAAGTGSPGTDATVAFSVAASGGGDYDGNGIVDGGDILLWQRLLGSVAEPAGSGADGDSSGTVDGGDVAVWAAEYPQATVVAAAASFSANTVLELPARGGYRALNRGELRADLLADALDAEATAAATLPAVGDVASVWADIELGSDEAVDEAFDLFEEEALALV